MAEYTLKLRRFSPETGQAAYWQEYKVDLDPHYSVLAGILQARDEQDGTIGIRCSCQAAICGSCGVKINGRPALACHTHLDAAAATAKDGATIVVEPMGNMPVLKDLIVDMDAVHWKKMQRVTPWLIPGEEPPEREYIVPKESMVDVTQTMACIQCGCCVSDCLSMEVDPLFVGPAALAKVYRFVGDPRDGQHKQRLKDLAEDPHGIYDCTHCFNCIEACPKGVAPMSQIMRLRRIAGSDHHIDDRNNGHRHEKAFVKNIEKHGLLFEADLLPDSYGGKFHPRAVPVLLESLPVILKAMQRRKVTLKKSLFAHNIPGRENIRRIYDKVEGREQRFELNLYVVGEEDEPDVPTPGETTAQAGAAAHGSPAGSSKERSPNERTKSV